MKKIFFSFLSIILFSLTNIAQVKERQESTYLKVKSGDEAITYEFHSIRDFEENSEKILDEIITTVKSSKKEKKDLLTIEISITVTLDEESTTVMGSVTAPFSKIISEVKKLRTQLISVALG